MPILDYASPPTKKLGVIGWIIVWFARPLDPITRWLPWISAFLIAWGSGIPGWESRVLWVGLIGWGACFLGYWLGLLAAQRVRRWNLPLRTMLDDPKLRSSLIVLALTVLIPILRPTLYVNFAINKGAMDRFAQGVLSEPFSTPARYVTNDVGWMTIAKARRCPHGVALFTTGAAWFGYDDGAGFFYLNDAGECSRFHLVRHLWGNWYTFDN